MKSRNGARSFVLRVSNLIRGHAMDSGRPIKLALIAAALLATSASAIAQHPSTSSGQAYPSKPIRLVVPFAPGGGNDFLARIVGQKLGERLGQQFIIDNR